MVTQKYESSKKTENKKNKTDFFFFTTKPSVRVNSDFMELSK